MNTLKFFFAYTFFFFCTIAAQAQSQQDTSYDNTIITISNFDALQTQNVTLEDQNHISNNTPAASLKSFRENANIDQTGTGTDAFAFYFNHKQFLNPIYKKSAYC